MGGVDDERRLVIARLLPRGRRAGTSTRPWRRWPRSSTDELLDLKAVRRDAAPARAASPISTLSLQPKGYRLLSKIPRLPEPIIDHIVDRFGNLSKIMRATIDDLDDVEGVGETRAKAIKEGLSRLAESSILDRYS